MSIIKTKNQDQISNRVKEIVNLVSFPPHDSVMIAGSYSYNVMMYYSDIDLFQNVNRKSVDEIANEFIQIVKNIQKREDIFIADIKLGKVNGWNIIPSDDNYLNYKKNRQKYLNKVNLLKENKIITIKDAKIAIKLLKKNIKNLEFENVKKELRFGLLRWSPNEILKNEKTLRDGKIITIEDAIMLGGMFKLDTLCEMYGKWIEVSIIYDTKGENKRFGKFQVNFVDEMLAEIDMNNYKQNFFKSLKRVYSLAEYSILMKMNENDSKSIAKVLVDYFFNTKLGLMYSIINDINVIIKMIEMKKKKYLKQMLDMLIDKITIVVADEKFEKYADEITAKYNKISKKPNIKQLKKFSELLKEILNFETLQKVNKIFKDQQ